MNVKEDLVEYCSQAANDFADDLLDEGEFHPDWHSVRDMKFAELIAETLVDMIKEHMGLK